MPFVGSIIPSTLVTDPAAAKIRREREDARARAKAGATFRRALDEADLSSGSVPTVETFDAVQGPAGNETQQSQQDRQEHGFGVAYVPGGKAAAHPAPGSRLNLEG
ncbi:MAG: hypothetical protein IBJ11_11285 [Phycisphaerales bacterium]|nr:hypothetical protein [Phycisphaerales bacterium]